MVRVAQAMSYIDNKLVQIDQDSHHHTNTKGVLALEMLVGRREALMARTGIGSIEDGAVQVSLSMAFDLRRWLILLDAASAVNPTPTQHRTRLPVGQAQNYGQGANAGHHRSPPGLQSIGQPTGAARRPLGDLQPNVFNNSAFGVRSPTSGLAANNPMSKNYQKPFGAPEGYPNAMR